MRGGTEKRARVHLTFERARSSCSFHSLIRFLISPHSFTCSSLTSPACTQSSLAHMFLTFFSLLHAFTLLSLRHIYSTLSMPLTPSHSPLPHCPSPSLPHAPCSLPTASRPSSHLCTRVSWSTCCLPRQQGPPAGRGSQHPPPVASLGK